MDDDRRKAIFLIGPWLVGGYLDIFLQGILMYQFANYWTWYKDDRITMRLAVAGIMILTILKTVQVIALSWIQNIMFMNDIDGAVALSSTAWWESGNAMMVATIDIYVQAYFCYRLYVISRSKWVVAPIVTLFVFAWVAMVVASQFTLPQYLVSVSLYRSHSLNPNPAGADIIMSTTTAVFLMQSRKKLHAQASIGAFDALIRLTFQTAAPAALCAMFNLIFSQLYSSNDKLISTAFNQALPKLYAVSMMWTLNARREIRAAGRLTDPSSSELGPQHRWFTTRVRRSI
ncbi:hypothetical protein BDZ89DRAFT_938948 [Hymenopellis radicata]|nr:hypothetical protein BDZ89DRAFT_938948 [Hymenopellis radicata]